jgi:hypothetical protein
VYGSTILYPGTITIETFIFGSLDYPKFMVKLIIGFKNGSIMVLLPALIVDIKRKKK